MKNDIKYLMKGFTWRLCGTFSTFLFSFYLTNEIKIATMITFVEFFTKIIAFYIHEKIWEKVK